MKNLCIALAILFAASFAHASEESHKAAVEKLFDTMKLKEQYEVALLAGFNMGASLSDDRLAGLPPVQQTKIKAGMEKVKTKMLELMGWNVVKNDMAAIYMKHFTEDEITAVIELMKTPTGQMLLTKQIEILPESMDVGQKRSQEVMSEVTKIMAEAMQ